MRRHLQRQVLGGGNVDKTRRYASGPCQEPVQKAIANIRTGCEGNLRRNFLPVQSLRQRQNRQTGKIRRGPIRIQKGIHRLVAVVVGNLSMGIVDADLFQGDFFPSRRQAQTNHGIRPLLPHPLQQQRRRPAEGNRQLRRHKLRLSYGAG